jgi:hypothetical protein
MKVVHLMMFVCILFMVANISRDVQGMRPPMPPVPQRYDDPYDPPPIDPHYQPERQMRRQTQHPSCGYHDRDQVEHVDQVENVQRVQQVQHVQERGEDLRTMERAVLNKTLGVKQMDAFPVLGTTQPSEEATTNENADDLYGDLLVGDETVENEEVSLLAENHEI